MSSDEAAPIAREARITIATAQMVVRELLARLLSEGDLSSQDVEPVIESIVSQVASVPAPREVADPEAAAAMLGKWLDALAASSPDFARVVDAAADLAERDAEPKSFGSDTAWIVGSISLGVALVLFVAKAEGRYDFRTGAGYTALSAGIPKGFEDVGAVLRDAISAAVTGAGEQTRDTGKPPSHGDHHGGGLTDQVRHHGTHADRRGAGETPAPAAMSFDHLPFEDAMAMRDGIIDAFHHKGLLDQFLNLPSDQLYWARPVGFPIAWGGDRRRFELGAGLRADRPPAEGRGAAPANYAGFRIAVRLQSPRPIKPAILQRIAQTFDKLYPPNLVSVRWISPAMCLASNPNGTYRPWRRRSATQPEIGTPVNIAGGAPAAVSLFLSEGDTYYVLTAGHPLRDDGRGRDGVDVYSPPQPLANPDLSSRIGRISVLRTLPSYRLGTMAADRTGNRPPTLDYTLVRLDAGSVPKEDGRRLIGQRSFSHEPYDFTPDDSAGHRYMMKSAARTVEARGVLRSVSQSIEMYDPLSGRSVFADDLIELGLDQGASALPGDSGALLCVDDNGTLRPAAIVIAGSKAARLKDVNAPAETALYALPLTAIPELAPPPPAGARKMVIG